MNLPKLDDVHLKSILGMFFERSFDAIVIATANPGYPIVYANPQFCKMTGYALEELIGQSPKIFQGEKTNLRILEQLKSCLDNGTYFHGATINYRKEGTWYPVEWNIRKFLLDVTDSQGWKKSEQDLLEQQKTLVNEILGDVRRIN